MPRPSPGHFFFGPEAEGEHGQLPAWPPGIAADVVLAHPLNPSACGRGMAGFIQKGSFDQRAGVHVWVLQNIMMQPCTFNVPSPLRLTLLL